MESSTDITTTRPSVEAESHQLETAGESSSAASHLKPKYIRGPLLEHRFGKEPMLEQGFGHIPDVIKVKFDVESCG